MNFSDLFNHAPLTPLQSIKFKIGAENRLINNLTNINPDIAVIFSSRAATGYTELTRFSGKVKDIKLTSIEDLKMLPWHTHDWKTVGRRTLGL
jgi:hypothetical protein